MYVWSRVPGSRERERGGPYHWGGGGGRGSGVRTHIYIYIYVYYIYPLAVKRGNEKSSINGVLMGTSSING